MPRSLSKYRSAAFTRRTLTPMFWANIAITWSPSFQRSRPVSTNTQVSLSPIARCSSAATTDESTPPDSPRTTSSSPTCARTRAIWSSMMLAAVHSVRQPQMSATKRRNISSPELVWVTSGWNCTPYQRRASSAIAMIGTPAVRAITLNPLGSAVTRSPWLIQTSSRAGSPGLSCNPSSSALGVVTSTSA